MTTWWTSDTHFSHVNIIRYSNRPFAGVEEMNRALIAKWNERVAPDDVVWHLGDLALGQDIRRQLAMTSQLNGRRKLVPGNHDRVASFFEGGDQRSKYWRDYEQAGWEILPEELEHEIAGYRVVVSHFPYVGDSQRMERYLDNRPVDRGLPVIHGHVHTDFTELGRQFNVGVDVRDYAPVNESEIVNWLAQLPAGGPPG